ncbi:MAG: hypothetical protein AB7H66_06000 [Hyphomonadaceae bacterium]
MKSLLAHPLALPLGLVAAGLVWPGLFGAMAVVLSSPYERALEASFCGAAPHAPPVHCAACWIGAAALFIAAGVSAMLSQPPARRRLS